MGYNPGIPRHLQGIADRTPLRGAPKASSHPNTARVSAQNLSLMAKRLGRCGDINPLTGFVCVTQPHDESTQHAAVQIGGPYDGRVYSEW